MPGERRRRLSSVWNRGVREAAAAVTGWGIVAFAIALSPGFVAWGLQVADPAEHHLENELSTPSAKGLVAVLLASALSVGLVYAIAAIRSVANGGFDRAVMVELNRRLAFLLAIPFGLPFVFTGFEAEHPFVTLGFAGIAAVAVAVSVVAWLPQRELRFEGVSVEVLTFGCVIAMACWWAWRITELQILQHRALQTNTYDLGIYVNLMCRSLHGDFLASSFLRGGSHVSAHFDPILVALSPVLAIHDGAESLFALQAAWLASATLPIYLLGRRHVGPGFGLLLAFAYLMHPAVQGASLFDFHSLTLSAPFAIWAVYFLEGRRWWAYAFTIVGWLACREDMAIATSFLGLYAIVVHGRTRVGVLTIAVSAAYLIYVKVWVMPDSDLLMTQGEEVYGYRKYFRTLDPRDAGMEGILSTLVSNPMTLGAHLADPNRLLYLGQLLLPLGFLPLFDRKRWVLLGYGMAFTLLASRPHVFTVGFHYAATIVPALFAITPAIAARVVPRWRGGARRGWAFVGTYMVVSSLLSTAAFGAFTENERFVAGGRPMIHELTLEQVLTHRWVENWKERIDRSARVCASGSLFPHFARRRAIYPMPDFDRADWVLTTTEGRRPGLSHTGLGRLEHSPRFEKVDEYADMVVYRRRPRAQPTESAH